MAIDMLHTCNIKVNSNLISEINKCHLMRQKFFLLCFISSLFSSYLYDIACG